MRRTVHVVAHTHWDREWYLPAAAFRQRLVAVMDELVDLLARRDDFPSFLLDGQAILLDDYLAVRPEREADLCGLLAAGRLEVGPWYVLADEFLVSAEALVRNLIEGARVIARRGGSAMPVGYCPDSFGHPAALPTILRGFGLQSVVLWRGFGGEPGEEGDLHLWRAPDGSEVLLVHLAPQGYGFGANLPAEDGALRARWVAINAVLERRARSEPLLVMNGADHQGAQADLPEVVERLGALFPEREFRIARLADYVSEAGRAVRSHAGAPGGTVTSASARAFHRVDGELRFGHRHAWALQGTHGSRLYLKQANAECQRLLERYAEPLAAVAELATHVGDAAAPAAVALRRRALLASAWRTLLENHAHDSICGTGADEVHREMMERFARARAEAIGIAEEALLELAGHDPAAARATGAAGAAGPERWPPPLPRPARLLLFNPSPERRTDVVEAEVALFRAEVAVGPTSAAGRRGSLVGPVARAAPVAGSGAGMGPARSFALRDEAGTPVPCQVLERRVGFHRILNHRHYPRQAEVEWCRVAVLARSLPALGLSALEVSEGQGKSPSFESDLGVAAQAIENVHLLVRVLPDGTLAVTHQPSALVYRGLAGLEDGGDVGDSYTFSAPAADRAVRRPVEVATRVLHTGPLRGALEVVRRFMVPAEATARVAAGAARAAGGWAGAAGAAVAGRAAASRRSATLVPMEVVTRVVLDADSPLLVLEIEGENPALDHRLRVLFPTGLGGVPAVADGHFGPIVRPRREVDPADYPLERPAPTAPMGRYVSVARGEAGLTVFADGLPEYELLSGGTVALTLLRAFGELSRADLPERPGHAGWPMPVPDAQCLGSFRARLAVCFHDERALGDRTQIEAAAERFHAPIYARFLSVAPGVPALPAAARRVVGPARAPSPRVGPELVGAGLVFSALKPAEDGAGIVLRCYNARNERVAGTWTLGYIVREAVQVRLDEVPVRPLAHDGAVIRFEAGPREVVSVLVRP